MTSKNVVMSFENEGSKSLRNEESKNVVTYLIKLSCVGQSSRRKQKQNHRNEQTICTETIIGVHMCVEMMSEFQVHVHSGKREIWF